MSSEIKGRGKNKMDREGERENERVRLTEASWIAVPRERECPARESETRSTREGKKQTHLILIG